MEINELIDMLGILKDSAEPIQTPDDGCGYSTLVKNVKCDDSFTWVIDEAIKELTDLRSKNAERWRRMNDDLISRELLKKDIDGSNYLPNELYLKCGGDKDG